MIEPVAADGEIAGRRLGPAHGLAPGEASAGAGQQHMAFMPDRHHVEASHLGRFDIDNAGIELEATQADGDIITLATGTLVVVRDIPAVG